MQSRLRVTPIKSRFSFFIISKNILIRSMYQTVFNVTIYRNKFSHFTFLYIFWIFVFIIKTIIITKFNSIFIVRIKPFYFFIISRMFFRFKKFIITIRSRSNTSKMSFSIPPIFKFIKRKKFISSS